MKQTRFDTDYELLRRFVTMRLESDSEAARALAALERIVEEKRQADKKYIRLRRKYG